MKVMYQAKFDDKEIYLMVNHPDFHKVDWYAELVTLHHYPKGDIEITRISSILPNPHNDKIIIKGRK